MAYTHKGRAPVYLTRDPIDPDSTDWFYFVLGDWLRAGETVNSYTASVADGTKNAGPDYYASRVDDDGVTHAEVYAVQATPSPNAVNMSITLRISTNERSNIDRTIVVPVRDI